MSLLRNKTLIRCTKRYTHVGLYQQYRPNILIKRKFNFTSIRFGLGFFIFERQRTVDFINYSGPHRGELPVLHYYVLPTYHGGVSRFSASDSSVCCRQNVSRVVRTGRMPSRGSVSTVTAWVCFRGRLRGRRSKSRVIISAREWYLGE